MRNKTPLEQLIIDKNNIWKTAYLCWLVWTEVSLLGRFSTENCHLQIFFVLLMLIRLQKINSSMNRQLWSNHRYWYCKIYLLTASLSRSHASEVNGSMGMSCWKKLLTLIFIVIIRLSINCLFCSLIPLVLYSGLLASGVCVEGGGGRKFYACNFFLGQSAWCNHRDLCREMRLELLLAKNV